VTTPVIIPDPPIKPLDLNGLPNGPVLLKRGFLTWALVKNAGHAVPGEDRL
jgi:hypothetical protein